MPVYKQQGLRHYDQFSEIPMCVCVCVHCIACSCCNVACARLVTKATAAPNKESSEAKPEQPSETKCEAEPKTGTLRGVEALRPSVSRLSALTVFEIWTE